ncbi:Hsp20/alpha crystallin family protein [Maribacter polysiphoniae]|uniref:HSP20 family protein n=1 Tax=Maribacter polysiphoniae TaxID=429344 RepID=A0A316E3U7_9FLAO|nr:Hsp20/alpha crystallin family protein [Maribacter polysiphoniae]MBD1259180.1 Hsp20/alpha crystallin family protein [Maribacter polysiphoniae]PWK24736.1 HSP20 family protein [Maribacter polysiphoniae]
MSLIKRNDVLFPSIMNEILKPDWFGGMVNDNASIPAVNIKENEKDYELELAVPGRKKEDFKIEVNENLLTVSSETSTSENEEKENYTRREFTFSSFKRAFTLPETIDEDGIKATYENGILKFNLPKKEEALPKPKRLIELS